MVIVIIVYVLLRTTCAGLTLRLAGGETLLDERLVYERLGLLARPGRSWVSSGRRWLGALRAGQTLRPPRVPAYLQWMKQRCRPCHLVELQSLGYWPFRIGVRDHLLVLLGEASHVERPP